DALREPRPDGPSAEVQLQLIRHPPQLRDAITLGKRRQDRFVPAAAHDLDLASRHEAAEAVEELGTFCADPGEERPAVMEGQVDTWMALEGPEHRQVGPLVGLG